MMVINSIIGGHLTAFDKKVLVKMLENSWQDAKTPKHTFHLESLGNNKYRVTRTHKERTSYGKLADRISKIEFIAQTREGKHQ